MQVIHTPTICGVCESVTLSNGMLYCTKCADNAEGQRKIWLLWLSTGNGETFPAIVSDEPSSMDDIYTALYLYDYCENTCDKLFVMLGFDLAYIAYHALPFPDVASVAYEVLKENTLFAHFTPNSQGKTIDYSYYQLKFNRYMPYGK